MSDWKTSQNVHLLSQYSFENITSETFVAENISYTTFDPFSKMRNIQFDQSAGRSHRLSSNSFMLVALQNIEIF